MKILICILLLATTASQSLLAQTTTLSFLQTDPNGGGSARVQNIPLLDGEVFELLTWSANASDTNIRVDGIDVAFTTTTPLVLSQSFVVAGPRTISVRIPTNRSLVCTYKVTTVSTVATQNVASQAVVIPENASAAADIIFESSTDLTNWTAAVAGSYSPSTLKRFFRVRLVMH